MEFKKMTKLASVLALVLSLGLTHCEFLGLTEDDDDNDLGIALLLLLATSNGCTGTSPVTLSGEITSDLTVRCGLLSGNVFVRSGATLTVPAGGQIFGADGSALFVLQGGKLNSLGTAINPVVFTSAQAVGSRTAGDWGGILIIGNAQTNGGVLPTEGTNPQNYGGPSSTNDADSSGTITYTRIEFAGDAVSVGNELNCLSLYAVGSGTALEHIQCHKGRDDSFEFFGGAVNAKFLVSTGASDDDFDMDVGYRGNLQHLLAYKFADGSSGLGSNDVRGFEWDGAVATSFAGPLNQASTAIVANFTLVGSKGVFTDTQSGDPNQIRVREGMSGHVAHGYITGFTDTDSREIRCDETAGGGGAQAGTNVAFYNTVFTMGSTTSTNTASCTMNFNTALVPSTGVAITTEADPATGTAPVLTPTVNVTGLTSVRNMNAAFNNTFFDDVTYAGAIDPVGADWTAGWTNWRTN